MATEKLYYADPYCREFTAQVVSATAVDADRWSVILDRTAFYPEGGGQPCDTGWLDNIPVLDVRNRDGEIVHICAGKPGSEQVSGRLDWNRRFDHMQQHSGEHVLSGAFLELFGAENVGFHLASDAVYIDVTIDPLTAEQAAQAEARANAAIYANIPIGAHLINPGEEAGFALRKLPPKTNEQLRIVDIPEIDCCPCCGTHLSTTGQIGLIKIRAWERKSGTTRVEFVCGGRALADYGLNLAIVRQLSTRLSTPPAEVGPAVERQLAKAESLHKELQEAKKDLTRFWARELYNQAATYGAAKVVEKAYSGVPPVDLADLARQLLECGPAIALLGAANPQENKSQLLFAASPNLGIPMGNLLKAVLPLVGGKGGGNAVWAQGGGPYSEQLSEALQAAHRKLAETQP